MKSDVLQELGEEKLATIIKRLVSGESTVTVARIIQEEWGEAQGLSRATLEKQLTSLRRNINRGGSDWAKPSWSKTSNDLQLVPLDESAKLTAFQGRRVEELFKKERERGKYLPALTTAIKVYQKMLLSHQKMRFELGVDVYKNVKLTRQEWQAAQQAKRDAENKAIIDAVEVAQEILKKHKTRLREIGRQEESLDCRRPDSQ
jgi:hypothetical protein